LEGSTGDGEVAGGSGGGGAPVVTALGAVLSTEVVVAFLDSVKEWFGVEPVCRVLSQFVCRTAPSTYYAAKTRPPSARDLRDEKIKEVIQRVWHDPDGGRELAGARKMWKLLRKLRISVDGRPVARCTLERLMREMGLFGGRRGQSFYKVTCAGPAAVRPADLVGRDFTATVPNRLWVVGFTYRDTDVGRAYAVFVLEVFSRRIVGWAVSDVHETELPLAALEMALHTRARAGHDPAGQVPRLVHHSDAGSEDTSITYQKALAGNGNGRGGC
jgi:putative transposase